MARRRSSPRCMSWIDCRYVPNAQNNRVTCARPANHIPPDDHHAGRIYIREFPGNGGWYDVEWTYNPFTIRLVIQP